MADTAAVSPTTAVVYVAARLDTKALAREMKAVACVRNKVVTGSAAVVI